MTRIRSTAALGLCGLCALALAAGAARAQPADGLGPAPQARVAFADLNLATAQGRTRLDARVTAAIARICPDAGVRDLARVHAVEACRAAARSGVQPQLAAAASRAQALARTAEPPGPRAAGQN